MASEAMRDNQSKEFEASRQGGKSGGSKRCREWEERKSRREVVEQATQKEELLGAPGRRHHTQKFSAAGKCHAARDLK